MFQFTEALPLSLYIHIPWCVKKCPYCDFNSHAVRDDLPETQYIDALLVDLEQELPHFWGRSISSIFIGGGTPSLFSPEALDRLLAGVRARLTARPDIEITMEANPGTFEQAKFTEFRQVGINRLSIGVQSFNNQMLERLGRIHDADAARSAAEMAHTAGFENFNIDLMYGLPGQSPRMGEDDLRTAIALQPTHISYYQLTIEPNTLFHAQPPTLPLDDAIWDMQLAGQRILVEHGYTQYEVSAYAQTNKRCRHNMNYWEFGDYIGIGAGAHGKQTDAARQQILRHKKYRQPQQYLANVECGLRDGAALPLSEADVAFEFMLNALRLTEGFSLELFSQRTGLPVSVIEAPLSEAKQRGLLEDAQGHIRPTAHGKRFLNDLIALFLPDDVSAN